MRQDSSMFCWARTCSDSADHGQSTFLGCRLESGDADAAGSARCHFDGALACQGLEVFLGGVGRLEAELLSNFRPGRRITVVFQAALDEREDLGLAGRQFQHVGLCLFIQ